jgi:hypothetical protein
LNESQTCAAAGSDSDVLFGYSAFTLPEYGSYRIWGNFISAKAGRPIRGMIGTQGSITIDRIYPVPASQDVMISLAAPQNTALEAHIYDVGGRYVTTLLEGVTGGGHQILHWDGLDGEGNPVTSGLYFCHIRAGRASAAGKLLLLR